MRKIVIIPILFLLVACHKDDTLRSTDKRLTKAMSSYYEYNGFYTSSGPGYLASSAYFSPGNYEWNDSLVVIARGAQISYEDDTIFIGNYIRAVKHNGRIQSIICNPNDMWYSYTYTYNNYGEIVSVETMCRDCVPSTTSFMWENGNVIKSHEVTEWFDGEPKKREITCEYTYDDKHTPYEGMEEIQLMLNPTLPLSRNNILTSRRISIESGSNITENVIDSSGVIYAGKYTYSNDYPIVLTIEDSHDGNIRMDKRYFVYADGTSANIPQICTITATANRSTEAGYFARGGGRYEYGATVVLYAFERDFIKWSDGNTDNPRTVIAKGDATYTAIYTEN